MDERILHEMEVTKLKHLSENYIKNTNISMTNVDLKSSKLNLLGGMSFSRHFRHWGHGVYESDLVYHSSIDVGKVMEQAYLLGIEHQTKNVVLILRSYLPKESKKILVFLITRKQTDKSPPKTVVL